MMKLHKVLHKAVNDYGGVRECVVILHGLFGQGRNWHSIAQSLTEAVAMPVYCLDLRNHGLSPQGETMTWEDSVNDLVDTVDGLGDMHLLGHSLGGKVAMQAILSNDTINNACKSLIAVDIAPRPYPQVDEMIRHCHSMITINQQSHFDMNSVMDALMKLGVKSEVIAKFLMTNLKRKPNHQYFFNLPLPTFLKFLQIESARPFPVPPFQARSIPTLVVKGAQSTYVNQDGDLQLFRSLFGHNNIYYKVIPNAGHWVHSQQPQLFIQAVTEFIRNKA